MPELKNIILFRYKTCENVYIYAKTKLYLIKVNWFDKEGTKLAYLCLRLLFALFTCFDRVKKVIIYKKYSYSVDLHTANF